MMKLPKIDLKKLKKFKEENFRERLEFIDKYAEWVLKTPNRKWSKEQKRLIDSQFATTAGKKGRE